MPKRKRTHVAGVVLYAVAAILAGLWVGLVWP